MVVNPQPNNNYLIRKLQTNLTQILHRIQLRPFASSDKLPDISVLPKDFQRDTKVAIQHDDLFAMAWQELYQDRPTHPENSQSPKPEVIPSTPETDNATTHTNHDLIHEPENIDNYPGNHVDDPTLDVSDEPEDYAPVPKSPGYLFPSLEKIEILHLSCKFLCKHGILASFFQADASLARILQDNANLAR